MRSGIWGNDLGRLIANVNDMFEPLALLGAMHTGFDMFLHRCTECRRQIIFQENREKSSHIGTARRDFIGPTVDSALEAEREHGEVGS